MAREGTEAEAGPELPRLDEETVASQGEPPAPLDPPQSMFSPAPEDTDLSVADRSPSQTSEAGNGSLVSRAQKKSQALREYFGLPSEEVRLQPTGCLQLDQ